MGVINEILLPNFLFVEDKLAKKQESPADHFDPVAAISDSSKAWAATTSPSQEALLKTIIFNKSSFPNFSLKKSIPLITKLRSLGFEVALCCEESGKKSLLKVKNFKDLPANLMKLANAKDGEIHSLAAENNIPIDKVASISAENYRSIIFSLDRDSQRGTRFGLFASHLNADAHSLESFDSINITTLPLILQNCKTKEQALQILDSYDAIVSGAEGEEFSNFIKAAPYLAREFIELFSHKITNGKILATCLAAHPEMDESTLDGFIEEHKIKIKDGSELALCIKAAPQYAEIFLSEGKKLIKNGYELADCIKAAPQYAEILLQEWYDGDEKRGDSATAKLRIFELCLEFAPGLLTKESPIFKANIHFIRSNGGMIGFIEKFPEFTDFFIENYKEEQTRYSIVSLLKVAPEFVLELIRSGEREIARYEFQEIVKEFPELAKELMMKDEFKLDKLGMSFETRLCLALLDPDSLPNFIDSCKDEICSGVHLASCLKIAPNFAASLIASNKNKIQESYELILCIEAAPEFAETLMEGYYYIDKHKFFKGRDLLRLYSLQERGILKRFSPAQEAIMLNELYRKNDETLEVIEARQASGFLVNDKVFFQEFKFQTARGVFEKQKPHFLSVADIDDLKSLMESNKEALQEVSVIFVRNFKDRIDEFLELAEQQLPNLCHVMVTSETLVEFQQKNQQKYSFEGINLVDLKLEIDVQLSYQSFLPAHGAKEIFVSKDGEISKSIDVSTNPATFSMVKAGEVLNGSSYDLQVRTRVIKTEDIRKSLKQKEFFPDNFKEVSVQVLDEATIENFKSKPVENGVYHRFNTSLKAGKSYRLLSTSVNEDFVGLISDSSGAKISLKRGDDDFYYAVADRDCSMSYVIKSSAENDFKLIPSDHPIKEILDEYLDEKKGYKISFEGEVSKYDLFRHQEWLEEIFEKRIGSCAHRVAAVEYKIRQAVGVKQEDIRLVVINNNHVILEVRYDGNWYPVDLGGRPANTNFMRDEAYKPKIIEDLEKSSASPQEIPSLPQSSAKESEKITTSQDAAEDLKSEATASPTVAKDLELKSPTLLPISEVVVPVASHILKADEFVRNIIEAKKVVGEEDELLQSIDESKRENLLINTREKIHDHANLILDKLDGKRLVYYIDSPDKIDLGKKRILVGDDGIPVVKSDGALASFLDKAVSSSEPPPLLLVNWDAFNAKQRLALNSLLDRERFIAGRKVPASIQVISLCGKLPKDISFLSRHKNILHSTLKFTKAGKKKSSQQLSEIDFQGFPDWRSYLFGEIILNGEVLEWKKSEFVKLLSQEKDVFKFKNIAPENVEKLRYELSQAKALGYLDYHGFRIPISKNLEFSFEKKSFDFVKFKSSALQLTVQKDVMCEEVDQEVPVINTMLFDRLLVDKSIAGGLYKGLPGLIENAARSANKTLKIFLTSNLSQSQWYCLLEQALRNGVKLEILLAKDVKIPTEVIAKTLGKEEVFGFEPSTAKVYVSNDAAKTTVEIAQTLDSPIIIDIEDFPYSDIAYATSFKTEENGFRDFKKIESQIIAELRGGRKVILKGEFPQAFLQTLHPILLCRDEFSEIGQNLILVIEDSKISKSQTTHEPLKFLSQDNCQIKYHDVKPTKAAEIYREDIAQYRGLSDSKKKADSFIWERQIQLAKLLSHNSIVKLSGDSGVGKSSLMESLSEYENIKVYRELSSFEEWDNDKRPGKTKILFIDESNIENSHLTKFSPLKKDGTRQILHKGKIYKITPDHKVVFAGNDKSYGGGRVDQKIFADGSIPEFHLTDFPDSYIYEKILKEKIYEDLNDKVRISEADFKKKCAGFILEYQKHNAKESDPRKMLTVRELQEQVLQYVDAEYSRSLGVSSHEVSLKSDHFISTKATQEAEASFRKFLNIRARQREGIFPQSSLGTNGILLKGDSGIGKSEMVRAMFADYGFSEAAGKDLKVGTDKKLFYRVDASMSLEEKTHLIFKALEQGNAVWIDEINSCIDDGLEKVLNSALNGLNLLTGKYVKKSGFALVATANHIDLEGRSPLSPALMHRMVSKELKSLKEYQDDDIEKISKHISPESDSKKLCEIFKFLRKEYPDYFNLRVFADVVKKLELKKESSAIPSEEKIPAAEANCWRIRYRQMNNFLKKGNTAEMEVIKKDVVSLAKELLTGLKKYLPNDLPLALEKKQWIVESDLATIRENKKWLSKEVLARVNEVMKKENPQEKEKSEKMLYLLCFGEKKSDIEQYDKLAAAIIPLPKKRTVIAPRSAEALSANRGVVVTS